MKLCHESGGKNVARREFRGGHDFSRDFWLGRVFSRRSGDYGFCMSILKVLASCVHRPRSQSSVTALSHGPITVLIDSGAAIGSVTVS